MREQFRIVERYLATLPFPWRRRPGGKHQAYEVEVYGDVVTVPVAFSPRDRCHAGRNTAKQIKRALEARQTALERPKSGRSSHG